jgi:uncharacterized membrane protein YbhN (UPF0104 family)
MLNRLFKLLILLSLVFLIYYLKEFDYLVFEKVSFNYPYLLVSVLLLWLGFYLSTYSWYKALRIHDVYCDRRRAVYSHGIAIFGKYIPGKIWVILGRATFIAEKTSNLKTTSIISLKEQLIYILLGLIISLPTFLILDFPSIFKLGLLLIILGLAIFLFSEKFHMALIQILNRFIKNPISVPVLEIKKSIQQSPYILLYWGAWILAFYFFCKSINDATLFSDSLSFPLSVSFGVLALIAPGGIGVREGIISTYLISNGWEVDMAITTAIISRIWFFSGEVFIFLYALVLKMRYPGII